MVRGPLLRLLNPRTFPILRNVAVIAHVDHGKTTLLRQCIADERAMDSITIASKAKICRTHHQICHHFLRFSSGVSYKPLEESIKIAVSQKTYEQIPDLLTYSEKSCNKQNPFLFLSSLTLSHRTRIVDEMLQSFIPLKPHCRLKTTYHYLLSYTLQSSHPFPLALAILQRTLRSGCTPVPQTHLSLSAAWIHQQRQLESVPSILLGMKSIAYCPDSGTCNFVIRSLCAVDQLEEAVEVLRGMSEVACVPDAESYCTIIDAYCELRKTNNAVVMMKEMVRKLRLSPRQGTLVRLAASLRANKEIWIAAEMIEFLEKKGFHVGFESYELVVEGCLECNKFILAGKMTMMMTEKGYIPYIKVRQKVVEGLAGVDEWKLACAVRHRFAEMNS
ncbi:pentatricopeptide repeat-containing protein At1g06270 [Beta vulgaris subsp. vulgaris]|uniref:pentatricopeptide repeat-containing protein At1g06270 n=1 Tax=Beta vulgaris subsp. vulgaris TaxID=3555 RepID=UPI0020369257|nr:pentatricopeptide repeat-containing protein At1g06270 [Beta vulgaris subsp. vulgaris]